VKVDRATELATPSKRDLGQVIEWLAWSAIVGYSERIMHVFLPLDDRGVDGIARRVDDDAMCAIQVKGRTSLFTGELQVVLRGVALADENVTVVVALLDPATIALGETVFVFDVPAVTVLARIRPATDTRLSSWPFRTRTSRARAGSRTPARATTSPIGSCRRRPRRHSQSRSQRSRRVRGTSSVTSPSWRSCACWRGRRAQHLQVVPRHRGGRIPGSSPAHRTHPRRSGQVHHAARAQRPRDGELPPRGLPTLTGRRRRRAHLPQRPERFR
jgi:hypothetical protein